MGGNDTPKSTAGEELTQEAINAAMADVQTPPSPTEPSDAAPEGDFVRFPKLPASVRDRIWKDSIPGGRVVAIVFDKGHDRYFSFHAVIPSILHTSKESRAVGLKFYTICFGTESHPAAIPFDFQVDSLLFSHWLAILATQYFRSRPPVERQIELEMQQIVGPIGYVERNSIHRIAISVDIYGRFNYNVFIPGLRVLLRNFPSTEYVIFVAEERNPFMCFFDVTRGNIAARTAGYMSRQDFLLLLMSFWLNLRTRARTRTKSPVDSRFASVRFGENIMTKDTSVRPQEFLCGFASTQGRKRTARRNFFSPSLMRRLIARIVRIRRTKLLPLGM